MLGRTHRLTFREFRETDDPAESADVTTATRTERTAAATATSAENLHPLEHRLLAPHQLPEKAPTTNLLLLLRCIKVLNDDRGLLADDRSPKPTPETSGMAAVAAAEQAQQLQQRATVIPASQFVNHRIASKVVRQVSDLPALLSYTFPDWCHYVTTSVPFLIPIESRLLYFYYTAFGPVRALQRYQELHSDELRGQSIGGGQDGHSAARLARRKVRVRRGRIVESAFHVMHGFASSPAIVEIEFVDEVGTGLGPTLEYYSLVSQAFQAAALKLWRGDITSTGQDAEGNDTEYAFAPEGLFPAAMAQTSEVLESTAGKKVMRLFRTLGQLLARAILDGRRLDLPLSPVFYQWLLGREAALDASNLADVDAALAQSLSGLQAVAKAKARIEADASLSEKQRAAQVEALRIDGARVEDLALSFVFPGTEIPLGEGSVGGADEKRGGGCSAATEDVDVTLSNLESYLKAVVQFALVDGVRAQMVAVRRGFNSVFSSDNMHLFSVSEMASIVCGQHWEPWTVSELASAVNADHGFTSSSDTVLQLIAILSKFDRERQRMFMTFVTGSPSLPVGGLRALRPQLTVVRKGSNDRELPSVMTCQNYLKLPEYSTMAILEAQLWKAVELGRGSFDLS
jgi:E3 ubiquitin-protein ligase TRIP12